MNWVFNFLVCNSVQNAMVGPSTSLEGGLIAAGSLFIINFALKNILYRSKKASELIQGHPVMLVYDGKIITQNLQKTKISLDEIEAAVREHGVKDINDVDLAVLEVDGNISVLSDKFEYKTVRKRKAHKIVAKET